MVEQEAETVSVASSESFADQGYPASEGMAEELGPISPSETIQSASPVDIMSLNGGSAMPVKQSKDSSSDSDEGCATWGSRHGGNVERRHQPIKRQNSYEEDPEIATQIHLTLANLDANLAEMNQSDGAPVLVDEIPVSIVDMDIPVTTIDEVPVDDQCSINECEMPTLHNTPNITKPSCILYEAIQNKNNNACLTVKNLSPPSSIQKHLQELKTIDLKEKMSPPSNITKQLQEPKPTDMEKNMGLSLSIQKQLQESKSTATEKNTTLFSDIHKQLQEPKPITLETKTNLSPDNKKQSQETKLENNKEQKFILNHDIKGKVETEGLKDLNNTVLQKSQNYVVGPTVQSIQKVPDDRLKSIPVVQRLSTETVNEERMPITRVPATQGKITQMSVSRFGTKTFVVIPPKPTVSQSQKPAGSFVIGAIKIDEQGNMVTHRPVYTVPEKNGRHEEQTKAFWSSAEKQDQPTVTNQGPMMKKRDTDVSKPSSVSEVAKLSETSHSEETSKEVIILENNPISVVTNKPSTPHPLDNPYFSGEGQDSSSLKPCKRTPSQYVAPAIAKNNNIPSTKIDTIQESSESIVSVQKLPFKKQFTNENKHTNALPVDLEKPATNLKQTDGLVPSFAEPKHSQSYPINVVEKVVSSENISSVEKKMVNREDGTKSPDLHPMSDNNKLVEFSFEEATTINKFQDTASARQMLPDSTRPPLKKKPELHQSECLSEPNLFGPVRKFKPVNFKPVHKESSLYNSLMEAIQSGEGIERLKKVSDSSSNSTVKKPLYVDSETEHSALLSAIRAPSNSARLKKTKSGAAKELEQLRKADEERNFQSDSISPPPSLPTPFVAPPPPAFSPPPPSAKPPLLLPTGGNPEAAREALLEAIRSGSGAQRLKKVPVTQIRRQVNGRLGTIQATLALSPGH